MNFTSLVSYAIIISSIWTLSSSALPIETPPPPIDRRPAQWELGIASTSGYLAISHFDFDEGVGVADPNDRNNPCTALLLGFHAIPPAGSVLVWHEDQNMGANFDGSGVGISNLVPTLDPPNGWLPNSGGINLGFPCPIPGASAGNLWLVWSGVNWHSAESNSLTRIWVCSDLHQGYVDDNELSSQTIRSSPKPRPYVVSSRECLPFPGSNMRLIVSACEPDTEYFQADYTDGVDYWGVLDTLQFANDFMTCTVSHSHDYTNTVQDFGINVASQAFELIRNEAIVHSGSVASQSGGASVATYVAICWTIDFVDFRHPLVPFFGTAYAHDWKLIFDMGSIASLGTNAIGPIAGAIQKHYGGMVPGDSPAGGATVALRGFHNTVANLPNPPWQFGPCPNSAPLPEPTNPVVPI